MEDTTKNNTIPIKADTIVYMSKLATPEIKVDAQKKKYSISIGPERLHLTFSCPVHQMTTNTMNGTRI